MSNENIRYALQAHLEALEPGFPTAGENLQYTPKIDIAYQEIFMLYGEPTGLPLGCKRRQEQGIFQVTLKYPSGEKSEAAQNKADAILQHFERGSVLSYSGQSTTVHREPSKVTLGKIEGRYTVVISIPYFSEVFN